jgi:uncharacterized membrane protein
VMERTAEELASLKTLTLVVYALQILSVFVGITAIVGVIINYIKREEAAGTLYASHFDWQIRTFWWGLVWSIVGFVLLFAFGLGLLVWFVAGIWALYRVIKGFIKLNDNQPVVPA